MGRAGRAGGGSLGRTTTFAVESAPPPAEADRNTFSSSSPMSFFKVVVDEEARMTPLATRDGLFDCAKDVNVFVLGSGLTPGRPASLLMGG